MLEQDLFKKTDCPKIRSVQKGVEQSGTKKGCLVQMSQA